jgi:Flp pilus assembly protein TadD
MTQNHSYIRLYRYSLPVTLVATLLLLTPIVSFAQSGGGIDQTGTGGRHSISGRLIFPSGQRADLRLKIRLESPGVGDLTVLSDVNGNFTFQSLRPGNYSVTIDGEDQFESVRENIFIEPSVVTTLNGPASIPMTRPFNVQIYLRPKNDNNAGHKPGVLNAALATVPKPAVELYEKGIDFAKQNETEKAIDSFKKAVALHPNFGLALNELGVQYLKRGELDKAAEAFTKVLQLSPDAAEASLNYGIVLLNQKKFTEAETQLRTAVKKNEHSFTAHQYFGISLIYVKNYPEAETELRRAIELGGPKASQAHYYLGGLYWKAGNFRQAADELETYLKLEPKAANADKVKTTVKELRTKS